MSDYIQLYANMGHQHLNNDKMVKDDFYVLVTRNHKMGLRNKLSKSECIIFKVNDKDSVNLDYLCSDLVRFCLSLYKNNQHNDGNAMSLIPKQSFPISEELRRYIEKFLPDYHGIRK
jgi:hypothetical protein